MKKSSKSMFPKLAVLGIVAVVFAFVLSGCISQPSPDSNTPDKNTSPTLSNGDIPTDPRTGFDKNQEAILKAVADGIYSSQESYPYHSGTETVTITVTVKDDIITQASVTTEPTNAVSMKIIKNFNDALPELAVGKKIDELEVPKNVAGSSLTSAAFAQYIKTLVETK